MENWLNEIKPKLADSDIIRDGYHAMQTFNTSKLKKLGFTRKREDFEFITTYPPLPALEPIDAKTLFPNISSKSRSTGLYIHLPFCTGICTYCGRYVKFANRKKHEVNDYIKNLKNEIQIIKSVPELKNMKISWLYFGGGTPTYLTKEQLRQTLQYVNSNFEFEDGIERTIETSPETLTKEKLDVAFEEGINRVSIGVQSFDDRVLRACNRRHDASTALNAFNLVKEAGFENINIDLMVGLPYQTLESWQQSLEQIKLLQPKHVTVYYTYMQKSCEASNFPRTVFPSEDMVFFFRVMATEMLRKMGYEQNQVYYFSKGGHSLKAWDKKWGKAQEFIGLGVSSYGFINNIQYHNHLDLKRYYECLDNNILPLWKGKKLDEKELMARFCIFGLKSGGIDKSFFKQRFGISVVECYNEIFKELEGLDLIEDVDGVIKFTELGFLFSEEVCLRFFSQEVKEKVRQAGGVYCGYWFDLKKYY